MSLQNYLTFSQETLIKLPQKKLSQVMIFLLLVYIAYLMAKITWFVMPMQTSSVEAIPSITVPTQTNNNLINTQPLQALNIFGDYSAQPLEEVVEEVISEDAPETNLQLSLKGVVASTNDAMAAAIIESSRKQETYGIGDNIQGTRAVLERVYHDRVILKVSGRLETLMIEGIDYDKQVTRLTATESTSTNTNRSSLTKRSTNRKKTKLDNRKNKRLVNKAKQVRETLVKEPGKITDYLKITPKRVKGKIVGYRLNPGKDKNFFDEAGLKAGDVAIAMNNFDLTDLAQAAQAMKSLKEASDVTILLDRDGDLTEILFSLQL